MNEDYPSCDETHATLCIYPSKLSAGDVTKRLGISPSRSVEAGDITRNSKGRERVASRSAWFLSSEGHVESKDLREHLNWLVGKLEAAREKIASLQCASEAKLTVSCVWWSKSGHGGPTLWPEQMFALANLNLECAFDIYISEDIE